MIFADRGKPAKERAADIDFAFRDPALLGLDPAFKSRIPIDRIFDCAARRRGLILRGARKRIPKLISAAVIGLFRVREPAMRLKYSAVAVLDLRGPIGPLQTEVLPFPAFRQQRAIALDVGFGPRHVA